MATPRPDTLTLLVEVEQRSLHSQDEVERRNKGLTSRERFWAGTSAGASSPLSQFSLTDGCLKSLNSLDENLTETPTKTAGTKTEAQGAGGGGEEQIERGGGGTGRIAVNKTQSTDAR